MPRAVRSASTFLRRALSATLIAAALITTMAPVGWADVPSAAMRDLAEATDFRVRVSAALVLGHLGRARPDGARQALETALGDGHAAVRVAAAGALGSLGDPSALPALERRLAQDSSASVTAQLRASIAELERNIGPEPANAGARRLEPGLRYLVELGSMNNGSRIAGTRGDGLALALAEAARARAAAMRGTAFLDGDDGVRQQAARRHVPVITLDGQVTQVSEARIGGGIQVQVRVEFAMRRGQILKGTLSGTATTFGAGADVSEQARRKLEEDAVRAAVQSALRGAEEGLLVAAR